MRETEDVPRFAGEIVLACGHGWRGECESEAKAQEFLDLCTATNDTGYCKTCKKQQPITGPIRQFINNSTMDAVREKYLVMDRILKNAQYDGKAIQAEIREAFAELRALRDLLVFADGCVLANNLQHGEYDFVLADLYAEDCEWAQQTLATAGCHPRRAFMGTSPSGATDA